jgi:hypothetical protein
MCIKKKWKTKKTFNFSLKVKITNFVLELEIMGVKTIMLQFVERAH